jgi:hypothetical protein
MNANLHDYVGKLLHQHLQAEDMRDAEECYFDDLERELHETGVIIGHDRVSATDADLAFYETETAAFDELQRQLAIADPGECADLLAAFGERRQRWIRETFIPQLAKRIDRWERANNGEETL